MRLLEVDNNGELSLTDDLLDGIPPYAILSHTCGKNEEEVTLKDFMGGDGISKVGYGKICFCAKQAGKDGLQYIWVDTCCIDKTNNVELTEAINSMFRWYQQAARCYVYLADVSATGLDDISSLCAPGSQFYSSRWFTRGWTLQELLAPKLVEFFSKEYQRLVDRNSLEHHIHNITRIPSAALRGTPLNRFTVQERLAWQESRNTKREEDKYYSLLGILDVSMSTIYGEGEQKALRRLCGKLTHTAEDQLEDVFTASHMNTHRQKRLKTSQSQSPADYSTYSQENEEHNSFGGTTNNGRVQHPSIISLVNPCVKAVHGKEGPMIESAQYDSRLDHSLRKSLIEKLHFVKIDERLSNLISAQVNTCNWILEKPEYLSWRDTARQSEHGGFLWIKGHPGTARGALEERSIIGLYRSLLHQLFAMTDDLQECLDWMTNDSAKAVDRSGWYKEALKQTFVHVVQNLRKRNLTIFVDALDECAQSEVADMISFFEELCSHAEEARTRLRICLSSRHYPDIAIEKGIELALEDEDGHADDIQKYIKSKLRMGKLKQAVPLRQEIFNRSSKIFLWVVLVVGILNTEHSIKSITLTQARKRLQEIPPELGDLFKMILSKGEESFDQVELCLKWILFATRSLKPQELYFAVQIGLDKGFATEWDQEDVDLDLMKSFVKTSSRGLAEVTRNKATEVQFIHESVRDFLLGKYGSPWSRTSGNFIGDSHEQLRDCCMQQLTRMDYGNAISSDFASQYGKDGALKDKKRKDQERQSIVVKYPFLEYAVANALAHANAAQQNDRNQSTFLQQFSVRQWIPFHNLFLRYHIRCYSPSASLLYVLAAHNLANLIRICPQREEYLTIENERCGVPILAAALTDSHESHQVFMDMLIDSQPHQTILETLRKHCSLYKGTLLRSVGFKFNRNKDVHGNIGSAGDVRILAFWSVCAMLETTSIGPFQDMVLDAVKTHDIIVLKTLLESIKLDTEIKDKQGRTLLSVAALQSSPELVRLIVDASPDVESQDCNGQTALSLVASRNSYPPDTLLATATALLEAGAVIESRDRNGRTPLSRAVYHLAMKEMVELLHTRGADIDTEDNDGHSPLWHARSMPTQCGYQNGYVELLLFRGAKGYS